MIVKCKMQKNMNFYINEIALLKNLCYYYKDVFSCC